MENGAVVISLTHKIGHPATLGLPGTFQLSNGLIKRRGGGGGGGGGGGVGGGGGSHTTSVDFIPCSEPPPSLLHALAVPWPRRDLLSVCARSRPEPTVPPTSQQPTAVVISLTQKIGYPATLGLPRTFQLSNGLIKRRGGGSHTTSVDIIPCSEPPPSLLHALAVPWPRRDLLSACARSRPKLEVLPTSQQPTAVDAPAVASDPPAHPPPPRE